MDGNERASRVACRRYKVRLDSPGQYAYFLLLLPISSYLEAASSFLLASVDVH